VAKEIRTYCPRCNTHTVHRVKLYKKGKDSSLRWGQIRYQEDRKGYGGQKYPRLRRTAKLTKKMTLKLECKECGYTSHREGIRLKKLVIE